MEGQGKKIGNLITISTGKGFEVHPWGGFVREETMHWWSNQTRLVPGRVYADGFIEGKFEFKLPRDAKEHKAFIQGCIVQQDVFVKKTRVAAAGDFKIFTRTPRNLFEASIHDRWPVCRMIDGTTIMEFGEKDVRNHTLSMPFMQ